MTMRMDVVAGAPKDREGGVRPEKKRGGVAGRRNRSVRDINWVSLLTAFFFSLIPVIALTLALVAITGHASLLVPTPFRVEGPEFILWWAICLAVSGCVVAASFRLQKALRFLQRTEERYRLAMESASDGILIIDQNGKYIEANQSACEMLGYQRQELLGRSAIELVQPESLGDYLSAVDDVLAGKTALSEQLLWRKDGSDLRVEMSGNLLQDGAVIEILRDITGRKQAEKELRASEERYRILAETASDAIISINDGGEIVYVNPAAADTFGYAAEELLGRELATLIPDQAREAHRAGLARYARTRERCVAWERLDFAGLHKSGRVIPLEVSLAEFHLDGEHIITGILRDVTDRTRALEALRASENRYRLLFERNLAGVFLISVDGKFLGCNESFGRILGYGSTEELSARNASDLHPDPDQFRAFIERLRQEGALTGLETCLRCKDGSPVWVLQDASLIEVAEGQPPIVQGTLVDITARKEIEERMSESLREKEILLKEVHHRVKNNLQIISSLLALQAQYIDDPCSLEELTESQNRIKSMALLHELLYQSQDLAHIDFARYVRSLTEYLFSAYRRHGSAVRLHTRVESLQLDLDTAIPCGLIVNELVSNALKYAFPGDRKGEICVEFGPAGDGIVGLTIRDTGVGLPKTIDFTNSDTLGLRLVNKLVCQLKGFVEFSVQDGTRFKITFPARRRDGG